MPAVDVSVESLASVLVRLVVLVVVEEELAAFNKLANKLPVEVEVKAEVTAEADVIAEAAIVVLAEKRDSESEEAEAVADVVVVELEEPKYFANKEDQSKLESMDERKSASLPNKPVEVLVAEVVDVSVVTAAEVTASVIIAEVTAAVVTAEVVSATVTADVVVAASTANDVVEAARFSRAVTISKKAGAASVTRRSAKSTTRKDFMKNDRMQENTGKLPWELEIYKLGRGVVTALLGSVRKMGAN